MEDFDYIDALAKSELSGREAMPSNDGWAIVQAKLQRKRKKRRLLLLLLLFVVIGFVGIYQGINFNSVTDVNSITNQNTNLESNSDSTSISDSISNSDSSSTSSLDSISNSIADSDAISQAEKNTLGTNDETHTNPKNTNAIQGSENGIVHSESKVKSSGSDTKNKIIYNGDKKLQNNTSTSGNEIDSVTENHEILAEGKGLQLYAWELISPDTLKKKRKKRKKSKKPESFYKNMDVMVGFNGFFTPNDYQVMQSYVVEVSYEFKSKLKNDYEFNYGAALQLRNLRFKKDSIRFNSGELSFNLFSNIEKRFGDYSIEAGAYLGYEIYSPNNKFFNTKVQRFFDQKINYGLSAGINYKNVGLIFKYELSPYINNLGDKKYGGFILGVKYDF